MSESFSRIINAENKRNVMTIAWEVAGKMLEAGKPIRIELKPMNRNLEQNAKLHAMLSDIARQKTFNGKHLSIDQWKTVFVSGHKIATGEAVEMAVGLEGEVINLRESTAKMSVSRCASLIEYIQAWASENGVWWGDDAKCE